MATAAGLSSREVVLWLLQRGHQPSSTLKPSAVGPEELLSACLEEVIALREQGHPEQSLALVDWLEAQGLRSLWLVDNRARALSALGRNAEARPLWSRLLADSDTAASTTARQTLRDLSRQLLDGLLLHCSFHSWTPQHLPTDGVDPEADLLHLALQEAITSRDANRAGLSLALMEEAINQGWSSPWVLDNRARALVNLGRRDEALAIWQELVNHEDRGAAALANEALKRLEAEAHREQVAREAQALLDQGHQGEAQTLLLEALIQAPDAETLQHLLETCVASARDQAGDLLSQQLAAVEQSLLAQELLLRHFEERLER